MNQTCERQAARSDFSCAVLATLGTGQSIDSNTVSRPLHQTVPRDIIDSSPLIFALLSQISATTSSIGSFKANTHETGRNFRELTKNSKICIQLSGFSPGI